MEDPVKPAYGVIPAGRPSELPFFDLEKAALHAIFHEHPETALLLRQQFDSASVVARENTGRGFITTMLVPESTAAVRGHHILGQLISAQVEGLRHGVGFALLLKEGRLHVLDGHCRADENTSDLDFARIGFTIGNMTAADTSPRDVSLRPG